MDEEKIIDLLDEFDTIMLNNLNENNIIIDYKAKESMLKIIMLIQNEIHNDKLNISDKLQRRFEISANALEDSQGMYSSEHSREQANKYFKWVNSVKMSTKIGNISLKDAMRANDIAIDTGHDLVTKYQEVLDNSKIFGKNENINLPKKQTFLDKIKTKLLSIFDKNFKNQKQQNLSKNSYQDQPEKVEYTETGSEEQEQVFKEKYKADNFKSKQPLQPEVLVISDIHGNLYKWNFIKQALKENPKRLLIIEGDAMDRGQFGLEILMQIKELSDEGKAIYLPGNHDVFAYDYLATKGTVHQNSETALSARETWKYNGGDITMEKFNNFQMIMKDELQNGNIKRPISEEELINWLGNAPIQLKIRENGVNYALSHAIFDDKLYRQDPNFNLNKALNLRLMQKETETIARFDNCMWYRENDKDTHYADIQWPEGHVMVVGHTRQKEANVQYLGNDSNKPIVYLDCGNGPLQGFNLTQSKHIQLEKENYYGDNISSR